MATLLRPSTSRKGWNHSKTSLSELQEQELSSLHLADTFPEVLIFTGFCPSFLEDQMLPSASSEAHDSLTAQGTGLPVQVPGSVLHYRL